MHDMLSNLQKESEPMIYKLRLAIAYAVDFIDDRLLDHRCYPWLCNFSGNLWPSEPTHLNWIPLDED